MRIRYTILGTIINSMIAILLYSWKSMLTPHGQNLLMVVIWFFSLVAILHFGVFIGTSLKILNSKKNETKKF